MENLFHQTNMYISYLRSCSTKSPLSCKVTSADVMDGIDARFILQDDTIDKFNVARLGGNDLVILHKLAVCALKDLVEKPSLVVAWRLVKDLRPVGV